MKILPSGPDIRRGKIYRDVYKKRSNSEGAVGEARIERARIVDNELSFPSAEAKDRAFGDGVFFLEIPGKLDVSAGDTFSEQFYKGSLFKPYGKFRDIHSEHFDDPLLGYHQRVNQIEQFLLERRFWSTHYPTEIAGLGEGLTRLSQQVLCSALSYIGVPERDWSQATGDCSNLSGSYHLTFNHYRPAHDDIGLNSHKDDGFLTILRTRTLGLEIARGDQWEFVPVDPSCFVINFGLSMEILSAQSKRPVAAIMHRVARQQRDRCSYGHFSSSGCLPGEDRGVFRYTDEHGLQRVCGSRELIDENDYEIYAGTEAPTTQPASPPTSRAHEENR